MSKLSQLTIHHLRNLNEVQIEPGPHFNIFCGPNGSGKTSLLEAIHYLGYGRSFRTRLHGRVINHEQPCCIVNALVNHNDNNVMVGIQKSRNGDSQVKLAGSPTTLNTIADLLPLQLIYPDGHKLLNGGPKYRRQYLDWGVFHVEHSFFQHWQRAQRALKQRNHALKQYGARHQDLIVWDTELANTAPAIDNARSRFVDELLPILEETLEMMELQFDLSISYSSGWDTGKSLLSIYQQTLTRDLQLGFTQYGPHKATLSLKSNNKPAHDVLSQGQQKMVIYALKLSQSKLIQKLSSKPSIYLIDDLPAELDQYKRSNLTKLMQTIAAQVFVTGIEPNSLIDFINTDGAKMFHVKHGVIEPDRVKQIHL